MTKPLRALLLAAGLGTRLRPLTLNTPKCLVPINGKPLLGHWLEKLEKSDFEAVLINTHHLSQKVISFLDGWKSSSLIIETIYEPSLLGTAGTLLANEMFFKNCTGLLVHADNAMSSDLHTFLKAHENRDIDCLLTMLTFTTAKPSTCGIVDIDNRGIVVGFHEKVQSPPSNRANGALYAFGKDLLEHLKEMKPKPIDFSNDVIPMLMGRIQTIHTDEPYIDIGTPSSLERAQSLWSLKTKQYD